MKIYNVILILMTIGLVVAGYLMGTDYLKQQSINRGLVRQIDDTSLLLGQFPQYPSDLKEREAALLADLEVIEKSFPRDLNSTLLINSILKMAEDSGVKAIPLVTQPWTQVNINELSYAVFRLNITATGSYSRLTEFIQHLETDEPSTMVIENMSAQWLGSRSGEDEVAEEARVSAEINLAVYARHQTVQD